MPSQSRTTCRILAFVIASAALAGPARGETGRNIELVIDCSGSMETPTSRFTSFKDKVEIAKAEVSRFVQNLPEGTRLAVRVFGTVREAGCSDSVLLQPLVPVEESRLVGKIEPLRPAFHGRTPIARNLDLALTDFLGIEAKGADNGIILLTDGMESCNGNVDAAIERIKAAGINLKVNIVGFDVLDSESKPPEDLARIAKRTGGKAEFPKTQAELEQSLKALSPAVGKPPAAPDVAPGPIQRLLLALRRNVVLVVVAGGVLFSLGAFLALRARGSETESDR